MRVTAGSAYFDGVCRECHPAPVDSDGNGPAPGERGQVVTNLTVGGHHVTLCATHTNELIAQLSRAGVRRDL